MPRAVLRKRCSKDCSIHRKKTLSFLHLYWRADASRTSIATLDASHIGPMKTQRSRDDPAHIVDHLIDLHGVDGALQAVREGIANAHANNDYFSLSVWREVRRSLQVKSDAIAESDPSEA
jgi:hypothetical protein